VSHDRYFLDRVCTRLLVIEDATVQAHLGNYSDWRQRVREATKQSAPVAKPVAAPAKPNAKAKVATPVAPAPDANKDRTANKERERDLRRLERRVETLEGDVGKVEAELATVRAELTGAHAGDWQKLHQLADRERDLDALLARRIAEWETAGIALANAKRGA
jgi:ATPase subunit of ABC transporter with duplicated ATPase domains